MRLRSGMGFIGAAGAAAVLGLASVAWACNFSTKATVSVEPGRGPAESVVRVSGTNWDPDAEVRVRFGGAHLAGPTADIAGRFSFVASIPPVAVGNHVVSASSSTESAATTFEVTVAATVDTGGNGGASQDAAPGSGATGGRVNAAGPGPDEGTTAAQPAEAGSGDAAAAPTRAGSAGTPVASSGGFALPTRDAPAATRSTATPRRGQPATRSAATAATPGGQPQTGLSSASALGDLWSGFASGTPSRIRGLGDLPGRPASSGPSPEAVGIGVLAGGAAALLAGFAFAETRRRRIPVEPVETDTNLRSDA